MPDRHFPTGTAAHDHARHRRELLVGLCAAVIVGVATAIQARVNGRFGQVIDDGIVAALVSFSCGTLILVLYTVLTPNGRAGWRAFQTARMRGSVPWWLFGGGLAGAFSVVSQATTVAVIGVALFAVGMIAGQTVGGLVLDRIGYTPSGRRPFTAPRVIGALLVVVAVATTLTGDVIAHTPLWMLVLPFAVGVGIAYQTSTNGQLRVRVGYPMTATLLSFAGGTLILAIVGAGDLMLNGLTEPFPTEWWAYLSGPLGVTYIALSATFAPRTGVLLMTLGSVLGLLAASIVIDLIWPPSTPTEPWHRVLTVVIAAAGVGVAALRRRRLTPPA